MHYSYRQKLANISNPRELCPYLLSKFIKHYVFPRNSLHSSILRFSLSISSSKMSISPINSALFRITLSLDPNVNNTLAPSNGSFSSGGDAPRFGRVPILHGISDGNSGGESS